jgi:hypothetical protein
MQTSGVCLKLDLRWLQARQRLMKEFLPFRLVEVLKVEFVNCRFQSERDFFSDYVDQ